MTNELEKQFFSTFGIEKRERKTCVDESTLCPIPVKECGVCPYFQYVPKYPQITDRILLELLCIVSERRILPNCDVNGLKEYVLKELCTMIMSEQAKHQVRKLFEEG